MMSKEEQEDSSVSQFVAITGVEPEQARNALVAVKWNLEIAVSNYFDGVAIIPPDGSNEHPHPPSPPVVQNPPVAEEEEVVIPPDLEDPLDPDDIDAIMVSLSSRDKTRKASLRGISVDARIKGTVASVDVAFKFFNGGDGPLESIFTIQQYDVGVSAFTVYIGGKTIRSECKEKDLALDRYDDAIAQGHGAYLLNRSAAEDIFTLNIGNLPPQSTAVVVLTYCTTLSTESEALKFVVPVTKVRINNDPRDVPVGAEPSVDPGNLPDGLTLRASIQAEQTTIVGVQSESHHVSFTITDDNKSAKVGLSPDQGTLQREFILLIGVADARQATATIERYQIEPIEAEGKSTIADSNDKAVMVSFYPKIEVAPEDNPQLMEIIFLLDRSGSMSGSRINQAKNALQLFLRSIPEHSLFNIVGFGDTHQHLFPVSREYTEETLGQAASYVSSIKADLGGTQLLAPLQRILELPPNPDFPRLVFLITDGEVANTDQVISFVRKVQQRYGTRVFTFGIGSDASKRLVRGVARAGRGADEFVVSGQRLESRVLAQLRRALMPAWTGIRIDWGPLAPYVRQAPMELPPIFPGEIVNVFAMINDEADRVLTNEAGTTVRLHGNVASKEMSFPVTITPAGAGGEESGTLIHRLAARAIVLDIEKQMDSGGISEEAGKQAVLEVAIKYSIVSKFTSLVAKEIRNDATQGTMITEDVNQALGEAAAFSGYDAYHGVRLGAQEQLREAEQDQSLGFAGPDWRKVMEESASAFRGAASSMKQSFSNLKARTASVLSQSGTLYRAEDSGLMFDGAPAAGGEGGEGTSPPASPSSGYSLAGSSMSIPYDSVASTLDNVAERMKVSADAVATRTSEVMHSLYDGLFGAPTPAPAPTQQDAPESEFSIDDELRKEFLYDDESASDSPHLVLNRGKRLSSSALINPPPPPPPQIPSDPSRRPVDNFILLQSAKGFWTLTADFAAILGVPLVTLHLQAAQNLPPLGMGEADNLWATLLAVGVLEVRFAEHEEEWSMIKEKATRWLAKTVAGIKIDVPLEELMNRARAALKSI